MTIYISHIHTYLLKKRTNTIYLNVYLFFFVKEIHAEKEKRGKHDNHVPAVKCKKIIWHNLNFFCFFFLQKRQSILPLKFTFLIKIPFDFRKHNTWLVSYLMAVRGGIQDKKKKEKRRWLPLCRRATRCCRAAQALGHWQVSAPGKKSTPRRWPH